MEILKSPQFRATQLVASEIKFSCVVVSEFGSAKAPASRYFVKAVKIDFYKQKALN